MKHVVNYSGGDASKWAARLVARESGTEDLFLLFADTFLEYRDLYRGLVESAADIFPLSRKRRRLARRFALRAMRVPPLSRMGARKAFLRKLASDVRSVMPRLVWIAEGRTPWEVFRDERFIGNTRVDPCSKILKRQFLDAYVEGHFDPADTTRYFGLDANEEHRFGPLKERLAGWAVRAPLIEHGLFKGDVRAEMERLGMRRSESYRIGLPTDNCSGGCVKGGQGHWKLLLDKRPDVYGYSEGEEQKTFVHIGRSDIGVLRDRRGGETKRMSLAAFREKVQAGAVVDRFDLGGCGCGV